MSRLTFHVSMLGYSVWLGSISWTLLFSDTHLTFRQPYKVAYTPVSVGYSPEKRGEFGYVGVFEMFCCCLLFTQCFEALMFASTLAEGGRRRCGTAEQHWLQEKQEFLPPKWIKPFCGHAFTLSGILRATIHVWMLLWTQSAHSHVTCSVAPSHQRGCKHARGDTLMERKTASYK